MRKLVLCLFATCLLLISVSADAQIFGSFTQPPRTTICVQDSMIGVTAETLINITGQGVLKKIAVDNNGASNNEVTLVTLDGVEHADSVSTSTTTVHYLVLDNTPAATTTEDYFMLSTTEGNLDVPFRDNLTVKFRTEAGDQMWIAVWYEVTKP